MKHAFEHISKSDKGFTLIEMAVVIIIIGTMLIPLTQLYVQYRSQQKANVTREHLEKINGLISKFQVVYKRYPCPADGSLSPGDSRYGQEINPECDPSLLGNSVALHSCAMSGGLCYGLGERDMDGVAGNDPVVLGVVPIMTLREALEGEDTAVAYSVDGWNSKLAYAVTQNQAAYTIVSGNEVARFKDGHGVIRAENEFGHPAAGINDDADYVLISRGPNRVAGFSLEGGVFEPCGNALTGIENENCNFGGVFVQALRNTAPGPNYYDDSVIFGKSKSFGLWAENNVPNYIFNLNEGFVGVSNNTPTQLLDVIGTIQAENNTRSDLICIKPPATEVFDPDRHCFRTDEITGPDVACPGQVLQAINDLSDSNPNPKYTCKTLSFTSLIPNQSCTGLNEWIVGFTSDGHIICEVP